MLEVLEKHLHAKAAGCVVARWIDSLKPEEKTAFNKIREQSETVDLANLFKDLAIQINLPFRLTAFRSHMRKYCTCQK